MTAYAVFLRAVNVGGNNKVPMARLREIAADLGYDDIATYVQSGNLVVTTEKKAAAVEKEVAAALRCELDVDTDVMVRSLRELKAVLKANPLADIADDPARMLVSFLTGKPDAAKAAALDRDEFTPERFELGDRCVYFWHPDGVGRSKMAVAPWHRRIGVAGTGRNVRTITKLIDILQGD